MPVLATDRHEQFAANLAAGMKQVDAYEGAGYTRSPTAASHLANRAEIRERVIELQGERAAAMAESRAEELAALDPILQGGVTRESLIGMLVVNARKAQTNGQINHANKAIEIISVLMGFTKQLPPPDTAQPKSSSSPLSAPGANAPSPKDMHSMLSGLSTLLERAVAQDESADEAETEL